MISFLVEICILNHYYIWQIQACEDGVNSLESLWCSNQFQFKEELMACLDKPFDQKEHDMLLNEAKTQKRLERRRDLRSRSVSYATGRRSMSYFDHYPGKHLSAHFCVVLPFLGF